MYEFRECWRSCSGVAKPDAHETLAPDPDHFRAEVWKGSDESSY